jgi:hypothetical protein
MEVIQNVQEPPHGPTRDVGSLSGRVSRIERGTSIIRVQPDTVHGTEVRVDVANAVDSGGRHIRPADIQAGDRVTLSGTYNGDVFHASTLGFDTPNDGTAADIAAAASGEGSAAASSDLGLVTLYGTVSHSLTNSPQLVLRDQNANRTLRVWVADDLVVRAGKDVFTTADRLKEGDKLVIKAYRDADGNYIAQTIRVR